MSGDCPDCGRAFSGKGPEPEGPNPDTMTEPGEKKRKKPKEAVHFTEDSPIWESRMGSEFFLLRALRTCWQILRHPQRTFAAPRHSGNSKGIGFLVTCWGTKRVVQLLIVAVISLHAGEAPPIKDILISLVIWPLDALISLVVVAGLLHLGVVLFHRSHKGFDMTVQSAAYAMGVANIMLLLFFMLSLLLGWAGAGATAFGRHFPKFTGLIPSMITFYLLFSSLKSGHAMSSGKAIAALVLPAALLAALYVFVWMR